MSTGTSVVGGHYGETKPGMTDGCSPLSFGLLRFGIRLLVSGQLVFVVGGKLFDVQFEFELWTCSWFRQYFSILGDAIVNRFSLCRRAFGED